jgi:hypothetical protein
VEAAMSQAAAAARAMAEIDTPDIAGQLAERDVKRIRREIRQMRRAIDYAESQVADVHDALAGIANGSSVILPMFGTRSWLLWLSLSPSRIAPEMITPFDVVGGHAGQSAGSSPITCSAASSLGKRQIHCLPSL